MQLELDKLGWSKIVSNILKAEMAKRGFDYPTLILKLKGIGVSIDLGDLRSRVSRGTFSAILFVQCLRAMGVINLPLEMSYFENTKSPFK